MTLQYDPGPEEYYKEYRQNEWKTPAPDSRNSEYRDWPDEDIGVGPLRKLRLTVEDPADADLLREYLLDCRGRCRLQERDGTGALLRSRLVRLPVWQAAELIQAAEDGFSDYTPEGSGRWRVELTELSGRICRFRTDPDDQGGAPAELAAALEHCMGERRTAGLLSFAEVRFDRYSGRSYSYRGNGQLLRPGDPVWVPVAGRDKPALAWVVRTWWGTAEEAPYPLDKMKTILGKQGSRPEKTRQADIHAIVLCTMEALTPAEKRPESRSARETAAQLIAGRLAVPGRAALIAPAVEQVLEKVFGSACPEEMRAEAARRIETLLRHRQTAARRGYVRLCPVCGDYYFEYPHDRCPVCGWQQDDEREKEQDLPVSRSAGSLEAARRRFRQRRGEFRLSEAAADQLYAELQERLDRAEARLRQFPGDGAARAERACLEGILERMESLQEC